MTVSTTSNIVIYDQLEILLDNYQECKQNAKNLVRANIASQQTLSFFIQSATKIRQESHRWSETVKDYDAKQHYKQLIREITANSWRCFFERSGVERMMDREENERIRQELITPPPFNENNIRATLERVCLDKDYIRNRGIANAFSQLDARFKSHDAFKVEHRIILTQVFKENGWFNYYYSDVLNDVHRVVCDIIEKPFRFDYLKNYMDKARQGTYKAHRTDIEDDNYKIRVFKNGNLHIWFKSKELITEINKCLHEFYGEVLPDGVDRYTDDNDNNNNNNRYDDLFSKSTSVSKDLAFYPTPIVIVDKMINRACIHNEKTILEPSAGNGNIVKRILSLKSTDAINIHAIEIDDYRFKELSMINDRRLTCQKGNFLNMQPVKQYDLVLMNPPFYGTHYIDHIIHAWDFLKDGGELIAILPATAEFSEVKKVAQFRKWIAKSDDRSWANPFCNLPIGSFKESGTNVSTIMLDIYKARQN